jgi:hypothetical protein
MIPGRLRGPEGVEEAGLCAGVPHHHLWAWLAGAGQPASVRLIAGVQLVCQHLLVLKGSGNVELEQKSIFKQIC